ncbi:MAG: 30S ribosomal protein S7 [Candidatus Latescibacteria bacterium]|nr:30S ribosomal protein S7 [bacterium]MBD3425308.1 30S ribosomal protein S7 [Candidatus Latescibacterota bacterium]
MRKNKATKREIKPDEKYQDVTLAKFINCLMLDGKKNTAEKAVYGALDILEEKVGTDGLEVFKKALNNVKPMLEVRSRRVGGATYQVPVEIRSDRKTALAMRWIIDFARKRSDHTMAEKLAGELLLDYNKEGPAIKKRNDTHKMAEANKAFAHYKW